MNSITEASERLIDATRSSTPGQPVRDLIGSTDVTAAYAVQQAVNEARIHAGATVIGRKIGLTSPAVQAQLGVDQPDFGVLFSDMQIAHNHPTPMRRLLQPKVEAEIAFVLKADLDGDITDASVRAAVDYAVVALEIVDSRIANWDITFGDTVADNASSGLFVLGDTRLSLDDFEPAETLMAMYVDNQLVSSGTGTACLGDPLAALAWLARTASDFGEPLRAGQVVLSGALGPMAPIAAGVRTTAFLSTTDGKGLGSVSTTFVQENS
jgi:2-keto-4-pentenoate hydratase